MNKVSRYDQITGYEKRPNYVSQTDGQRILSAANRWQRTGQYVSGLLYNIRAWIIGEQLTLRYYNPTTTDLSAATTTWLTWNTVHVPVGAYIYQLANQHVSTESTFTIFTAPQPADYLVSVYFLAGFTNITIGSKYIEMLICLKQHGVTWLTPFPLCGGADEPVNNALDSRIQISGSTIVRLNRGDSFRIGANNISSDGGAIQMPDLTGMEIRVAVTKVKFYPTLTT